MISIAMAVYNGEKFIDKQLESIVKQTKLPDEIVITDDSKNNDTFNKIEPYINKYKSINWKYIKNKERLGFCQNFIKAINNTTGDIIFLADQDDIWEYNKILLMSEEMDKNTNIDLLCCRYVYIDKNDKIININHEYSTSFNYSFNVKLIKNSVYHMPFNEFIRIVAFPGMCIAINKKIITELNDLIKSTQKSEIEYHDLILTYLAARNDGLYIYKEKLCKYRMHNDNAIGVDIANGKGKTDRSVWLDDIIKKQKCILLYEKRYKDSQYIDKIQSVVNFNIYRYYLLIRKKFFHLFFSIFKLNKYLSINSYFGDLLYVIKKL